MLEKLVPGDRVIKIPISDDEMVEDAIPYGASATVIENEKNTKVWTRNEEVTVKYGCVIQYDKYSCQDSDDGYWFRVRNGLMKISPYEGMDEEEKAARENEKLKDTIPLDVN